MNQVLAATVIITAIISMGVYVGSNITDTATSSTVSSNIDQQKKQEEIHAVYNGTSILLENRGKDTSEIIKYRFYDDTGSLVHEIKSDELSGGILSDHNRTLNRRIPSINSFWPDNATSGEIITSFGNVIPISFDVPSTNRDNTNGDRSGNGSGNGNSNNTQTVPVGGSVLAALGVSMTIVNYDITGRLFEGDSSLIGDQHNLIPYRLVPGNTTWVSAVRDSDKEKEHLVSLDGSSYTYNQITQDIQKTYRAEDWGDISFDLSRLKNLAGSPQVYHHDSTSSFPEWIKYSSSAASTSIIKLSDDIAGTDMIFHTFLEKGMSVDIVNSIHSNLDDLYHNSDGSVLVFTKSVSNREDRKETYVQNNGQVVYYGNLPRINVGTTINEPSITSTRTIHVHYSGPHITGHDKVTSNGDGVIYCVRTQCLKTGFYHDAYLRHSGLLTVSDMTPPSISKTENSDGTTTIHSVYQSCAQKVVAVRIHGAAQRVFCVPTSTSVSISDLDPYDILASHDNNRDCLGTDWFGNCYRYSSVPNSIHVQSNVKFPSDGTNYMIIRYDGDTSIGNTNTLLDEDHIFSYMNKFYQRTSDTTKRLTNGLAEANVFLVQHLEDKPIIAIDNLPPNMPYEITSGDHNIVTGFTDNTGNIELYKDDDLYLISGNTDPVILSIYPDSAVHVGSISSSAILDGFNKGSAAFDWREDTIYVPQNYVRIVFLKQADISSVRIDDTRLAYLDKLYPANSAMYIPVIPKANNIHMIISGEPVEISLRYVDTSTQIKVIPPQIDTDLRTAYGSPAAALSEIVSSTFFIAAHNGTLTAVMDLDIAGSVSSSYSTEYRGDVQAQNRCTLDTGQVLQGRKIFGPCKTVFAGTWGTDYFTKKQYYKDKPVSSYISAYQTDYTDTINRAIQSGALGLLTVEVTVFQNMELYSNDIMHVGHSAAARSSSGISEYLSAINRLELDFPSQPVKDYIEIPVSTGDIIEIIISVNTRGTGLPVPNPLLLTTVQQPPPQTRCLEGSDLGCKRYDTFNVRTFSYALSQVATKSEVRSGLITLFAN